MSDAPVIRREWLPPEADRKPPLHHGEPLESGSRYTDAQRAAVRAESMRLLSGPLIPASPPPPMVTKDYSAPVVDVPVLSRLERWKLDGEQAEREREEAQAQMRREEASEIEARAAQAEELDAVDARIAAAFDDFAEGVAYAAATTAGELRAEIERLKQSLYKMQVEVIQLRAELAQLHVAKSGNSTRRRSAAGRGTGVPVSVVIPLPIE